MKKKHLIWIIPICLIFGAMVGLYIALPRTITFDTGKNMKDLMEGAKELQSNMPNCSNNFYNITSYADYGYGNYVKLVSEIKRCNNQNEYIGVLLQLCNDKAFCHCEDYIKRNPIINEVLTGKNKERQYILWDKGNQITTDIFDGREQYGFNDAELRLMISYLEKGQYMEIWRIE